MMRNAKYLCIIILIFISLIFKKQALPVPTYPLSHDDVIMTLEEAELLWTVKPEQALLPDQTIYSLFDENNHLVAAVSSAVQNGQRVFTFQFFQVLKIIYQRTSGKTLSYFQPFCMAVLKINTKYMTVLQTIMKQKKLFKNKKILERKIFMKKLQSGATTLTAWTAVLL